MRMQTVYATAAGTPVYIHAQILLLFDFRAGQDSEQYLSIAIFYRNEEHSHNFLIFSYDYVGLAK